MALVFRHRGASFVPPAVPSDSWVIRTANALLAENFDYADLTAAVAGLPSALSQNPPNYSINSEHGLSGKAARQAWTDTTFSPGAYILHLSGDKNNPTEYPHIFVQVVFWGDEVFNWPFSSTFGPPGQFDATASGAGVNSTDLTVAAGDADVLSAGDEVIIADANTPGAPVLITAKNSSTNYTLEEARSWDDAVEIRIVSPGVPKIFIIDRYNGSATLGELVANIDLCRGMLHCYRFSTFLGNGDTIDRSVTVPGHTNVISLANAVDGGGGDPANLTDALRKWGELKNPAGGDTVLAGYPEPNCTDGTMAQQGFPNSDVIQSPQFKMNRGGHSVITVELDKANDRARVWASNYGSPPVLQCDTDLDPNGSAGFGGRTGWSGIHLTAFVGGHSHSQAGIDPAQHYTDYCEVISSISPIPHPGSGSTVYPLPGTSTLSQLIQGMSPGTWSELTGVSGMDWVIDGASDTALEWACIGEYDSTQGRIHWAGTTHGGGPPRNHAYYTESTNAWTADPYPPATAGTKHGYNAQAIDVARRTFYHGEFGAGNNFWGVDLDTLVWTQLADFSGAAITTVPCIQYFPERDRVCAFHGISSGNCLVIEYNADTNSWASSGNSINLGGHNGTHMIASYFPSQGATPGFIVFSNGESGTNQFVRYDSDGSLTPIAAIPGSIRPRTHDALWVAAGGKGYLFGNDGTTNEAGQFWEWDPVADDWTQLSTTPLTTDTNLPPAWAKIAIRLAPAYEAFLVFESFPGSASTEKMWVYKP